jgi:hypothetical protein
MLTSVFMYLLTIALQHMAFPASMGCVMIVWVGGSSEEDEGDDECDLDLVPGFVYESVEQFFYVHGINKHDKQNILDLELAPFHLKHKA